MSIRSKLNSSPYVANGKIAVTHLYGLDAAAQMEGRHFTLEDHNGVEAEAKAAAAEAEGDAQSQLSRA